MLATKCTCPGCGAHLKAPHALPAKLRCPRCGTKFVVPRPGETGKRRNGETGNEGVSGTVAPSRRFSVSQPPWLLAGLVLGAVLFLGTGAVLLVYCLQTPVARPIEQAENRQPDPTNAAAPTPAEAPGGNQGEPLPEAPEVNVPREELSGLPPEQQKKVNEAIDRGVAYLKTAAPDRGQKGRSARNEPGVVALAGLTLLECGVPADDPAVQRAVTFIRTAAPQLTHTYSLSLSILFLDRLGDVHDRPLIQSMALRLIAGQNSAGGWTYECRSLTPSEERLLLAALQSLPSPANLTPSGPEPGEKLVPKEGSPPTNLVPGSTPSVKGDVPPKGSSPDGSVSAPDAVSAKPEPGAVEALPPRLKELPVLQASRAAQRPQARGQHRDDNSNTQFAILAIWAARRHAVPTERTLALVDSRFRTSQNSDGSWGYEYPRSTKNRDSMTCAGLLGLAVGRGIEKADAMRDMPRDEVIEKGFAFLGKSIDRQPPQRLGKGRYFGAEASGDLYYLWSVERVAVAYDQRRIGGKDWYAWGTGIIVAHQNKDGSWSDAHAGVPDTCFALLFLKRANVAQDLTAKLKLFGDLKDVGDAKVRGEE